jgi:hypothetical protein
VSELLIKMGEYQSHFTGLAAFSKMLD